MRELGPVLATPTKVNYLLWRSVLAGRWAKEEVGKAAMRNRYSAEESSAKFDLVPLRQELWEAALPLLGQAG